MFDASHAVEPGVILYECISGQCPFNLMEMAYEDFLAPKWRFMSTAFHQVDSQLLNLIERLIVNDPEQRLTADAVSRPATMFGSQLYHPPPV